jgi:hypothetical protein
LDVAPGSVRSKGITALGTAPGSTPGPASVPPPVPWRSFLTRGTSDHERCRPGPAASAMMLTAPGTQRFLTRTAPDEVLGKTDAPTNPAPD